MGGSDSKDAEDHAEGKGVEGQQKLSCTPTTGGRRRSHRMRSHRKRSHRTHRKRSHSKRHSRRR